MEKDLVTKTLGRLKFFGIDEWSDGEKRCKRHLKFLSEIPLYTLRVWSIPRTLLGLRIKSIVPCPWVLIIVSKRDVKCHNKDLCKVTDV